MFEVSLRTIYRDIAAINASGIPVTTIPGAGGGIGIMEQYKIEKGIFTADDISAMLTGLGIMQNTLSGREITNALAKLKSFISDDQIHDINRKTMRIMFDLSPWIGGEDSGELIRALKSALEKKRTISFSGEGGPSNSTAWNRTGLYLRAINGISRLICPQIRSIDYSNYAGYIMFTLKRILMRAGYCRTRIMILPTGWGIKQSPSNY